MTLKGWLRKWDLGSQVCHLGERVLHHDDALSKYWTRCDLRQVRSPLKIVTQILFSRGDSNYHRPCTIRNKLVTHTARKRRHSAARNSARIQRASYGRKHTFRFVFAICFALPICFSGSDEVNTPRKQRNEVQQRVRCFPRLKLLMCSFEGSVGRE